MKKILFISFCLLTINVWGQTATFDITTYSAPKGWKKQSTQNAIQFIRQDSAKGAYCLITLYKSVPGPSTSKDNFDMAWASLVKEVMKVTTPPTMQAPSTENGWEAQSGYAPFESDGSKGIALLVSTSGYQKMVNILILTNTDIYQQEMTSFLESVNFKKPAATNQPDTPPKTIVAATGADGFAFSTTNFDDGWTSTVQSDWVEVKKGNCKVLLHYPKQGTIFPADPEPLTNAAWNILVAPRFTKLKNYKTSYINTYDRVYLASGFATENGSGQEVYIVFFRQGQTGWIEIDCPDKNTFIQQFKFNPDNIRWDSESSLMEPLARMVNYNKFAIAASDFKGSWTSDFTGMQQLYNIYTGNYAGMNVNQSSQTFQFGTGNTYNWNILAVNGMVGNSKVSQAKSAGKFSVLNNWQISFSNIEGKPKTYNAFFSCIKGARLLHMLDAQYPGSGVYTVFGKK